MLDKEVLGPFGDRDSEYLRPLNRALADIHHLAIQLMIKILFINNKIKSDKINDINLICNYM